MGSWHSYPKIYSLGHRALKDFFDTETIIMEEKIDGSQFSFGVHGGELKMRSRGQDIHIGSVQKLFTNAVATVVGLNSKGLLKEGYTYRGEVLQSPRHNVLTYDRVPAGNIYLFDVEVEEGDYLTALEKTRAAEALELEPVAYELIACSDLSTEYINEMLKKQSILGGVAVEGYVFKRMPYNILYGEDKKAIIAKYVSEKFKEVASTTWKRDNPGRKDVIEFIKEKYRTEARWRKAVQHLDESGTLQHAPQDIGLLIKEIQRDIEEEEAEAIKQILYGHFIGDVKRSATAGFPEWYKQQLLVSQFES